MANAKYIKGSTFERAVAIFLRERINAAVVKAAGSKGEAKADLVAFVPDGRVLLIQCKATDPKLGPDEWNALYRVSRWNHLAVALVATKGARGQGPTFYSLDRPRKARSRDWPWSHYNLASE